MEKSIDSVRRNFNTVRTGRANVSILDRIQASLARRSSRGAVAEPVDPGCCAWVQPDSDLCVCERR